MGYTRMITEGAKHVLGWKSPNYIYQAATRPEMKLLLKNSRYSDDITYRFSNYSWNEYPLTAEKFISWIVATPPEEELINLFMNYETLGNLQPAHTGIFEFFKALPRFAIENGIGFTTPSEAFDSHEPIGTMLVPNTISWSDEERDVSAWLGNKLQQSALKSLYEVGERVRLCTDRRLKQDWIYLQSSDHFTICRPNILVRAESIQSLHVTLRRIQQLHECLKRFHCPREGTVPGHSRQ